MKIEIEKLCVGISTALNVEPHTITTETVQGSLSEWDSFGHMSVIMALEEMCVKTIPVSEISKLISIKSIHSYIETI